MNNDKLSQLEVNQALKRLEGWSLDEAENSIAKAWRFEAFKTAVDFFVKVCEIADLHDHHPNLLSCYTLIKIDLTTHDAGGLTKKDFLLAAEIDELARRQFNG